MDDTSGSDSATKLLPPTVKQLPSMHPGAILTISRPIYTQDEVNRLLDDTPKVPDIKPCWKDKCSASSIVSTFPVISVIRHYKFRSYIINDILSGITTACLHVPLGLALGFMASLGPEHGLYSSFFPSLFYIMFGTSHHVSMGTNAVIALATAELVEAAGIGMEIQWKNSSSVPINSTTDFGIVVSHTQQDILGKRVALAAGATCMCGIILTAMGVFQLGVVTNYFSSSFLGGFSTAAAFHIFTSQISKGLGITVPLHQGIGKVILTYKDIFQGISNTNVYSLSTTILTLVVLLLVKDCVNEKFKHKMKMPIPIDFIVVVVATAISYYAEFNSRYNVTTCGYIPTGLPIPAIPSFQPFDILLLKSIEISALVFFITISIAKVLAAQNNYEVDDNKELIAYGLSNFGSSFFLCFPSATAPPRSIVLSLMGAKTTLNNAFSCIAVMVCLLTAGKLFSALPIPVLVAIILVATIKLLSQVFNLPSIYRANGYDFIVWVVTFSTAVFLDLIYGILFGFLISIFVVALQSQRGNYIDKLKPEHVTLLTGRSLDSVSENIVVLSVGSSLYFATASMFLKEMRTLLKPRSESDNSKKCPMPEVRHEEISIDICIDDKTALSAHNSKPEYIIISLRQVNYIDMKGMQALISICAYYKARHVIVILCECTKYVQKSFDNSDFYKSFPRERIFFTLVDAIEMVRIEMINTGSIDGIKVALDQGMKPGSV